MLRFTLLEHFGGIWIDATVYLTGKLPAYAIECDLFAFRDSLGNIRNPALMCSWFLSSKKGNGVIRQTRNVLFAYWVKEDHVLEYLLPYLVLTMVLEQNQAAFARVPYADSAYCYQMLDALAAPYDAEKYRYILSRSSIHKLTYKLTADARASADTLYCRLTSETAGY